MNIKKSIRFCNSWETSDRNNMDGLAFSIIK